MHSETRPRIIGGMFGLQAMPHAHAARPPFLYDGALLLANARSGISLLVELLSPAHIWMPSYLCAVMVKAVDGLKVAVSFYEVTYDFISTFAGMAEEHPA